MKSYARLLAVLALLLIPAQATAADGDWVSFKTLHSDGATLRGYYVLPDGPGPHPAVIMLHGCSGPLTKSGKLAKREAAWIDILSGWGYAVLLVDSFNPRGFRTICSVADRPIKSENDRPYDAYAALGWMAKQAGVDAARIYLAGWSHRAMTTLSTLKEYAAARPSDYFTGGPSFRAAFAYYPGCTRLNREGTYRTRTPLLILVGLADDWTKPKPCLDLARKAKQAGSPVESVAYEGAHHAFDHPGSPVKARTSRDNANKTKERTVHSGTHPEARAQSIERVKAWLAEQGGLAN